MSSVVVFTGVRPLGGELADLVVTDGVVTAHEPPGRGHGDRVVAGEGRIALPTLVDAHIHPDKTTWGQPWVSRRPASGIAELGRADADLFRALPAPVAERA
ncbi:MAG TPA: hypothetical protein VGD67_13575, partial [Pseudonocardiaceae bacterium]